MKRLDELNDLNSFHILSFDSSVFRPYGRILRELDAAELIRCAEEKTQIPESGNIYVASFSPMEEIPEVRNIQSVYYGSMPIEVGYCNGKNSTFNGFEYHKAPEINIAVTEFCLALGHSWDIRCDETGAITYEIDKADVFYVPKGTAFELYGTTLHLSPLRTREEGFKNIVILPLGTNTPLSEEEREAAHQAYRQGEPEARLLLQKNKWVISHPDREPLIRQGAHPGVLGPNKELKF